jgi:SAM-dependent methyltransferase
VSTTKRTIDWYNENADGYAKHVNNPEDSIYHAYYEKPAIRAELPDIKGKAVLSLGCGSGVDSAYLKQKGAKESIGIDISEKLVEIARNTHPDCEFFVMDMETLDFPDNRFDLVYSSLAMHYLIGGPQKALKEAYRVLKPGGILLFSEGHPLYSAMQVVKDDERIQERLIGMKKQKIEHAEEDFGNYLTSRVIRIDRVDEGLAVDLWHQPLSETINQIIEAGFKLEKVVEFTPKEGMEQISQQYYERLKRIPEMIIFKARK